MRKSLSVLSDEWMWKKYFISPYYRSRKGKYWTDRTDRNKEPSCRIYAAKDMLLPWRTIIENAALPLECQGVQKKEAEVKAKELLHKFGLQGYEQKYPKDLSGGMRQRVSFIRTLLTGGEILLLDEPFSALDALTKTSLQEWLFEQWQEWEKTILFITNRLKELVPAITLVFY